MAKQSTIYKSPEGVDLIRQKCKGYSCEGCFYWDGDNCAHPEKKRSYNASLAQKCVTITPVTRHQIYQHYVKAF